MRASGVFALAVLVFAGAACAEDPSEEVRAELDRAFQKSRAGVEKISHALERLDGHDRELGEGVEKVDDATRWLARLEVDPRATKMEQLLAVVYQARAWDEATRAFESARTPEDFDDAQKAQFSRVLLDKSFPARVAARNSYERALGFLCRLKIEDEFLRSEIIDGVSRNGGGASSLDQLCLEN